MIRKYALGMLKVSLKHFLDVDDCVVDHLLRQGKLHAAAGRERIMHLHHGASQWIHDHIGHDASHEPAM